MTAKRDAKKETNLRVWWLGPMMAWYPPVRSMPWQILFARWKLEFLLGTTISSTDRHTEEDPEVGSGSEVGEPKEARYCRGLWKYRSGVVSMGVPSLIKSTAACEKCMYLFSKCPIFRLFDACFGIICVPGGSYRAHTLIYSCTAKEEKKERTCK